MDSSGSLCIYYLHKKTIHVYSFTQDSRQESAHEKRIARAAAEALFKVIGRQHRSYIYGRGDDHESRTEWIMHKQFIHKLFQWSSFYFFSKNYMYRKSIEIAKTDELGNRLLILNQFDLRKMVQS